MLLAVWSHVGGIWTDNFMKYLQVKEFYGSILYHNPELKLSEKLVDIA